MNKTNFNDFFKKAYKKFGDKFEYNENEYTGTENHITITCPTHGKFSQTPYAHLLSKYGCPQCAAEHAKRKKYKNNINDVIIKAREIHGDKYDYSKAVYTNSRTPFTIICPIHGDFTKTYKTHITQEQGCPQCSKEIKTIENHSKFISESEKRFGKIYEFKNTDNEYANSHSKISVTCKKCGNSFIKIACDHITSTHGGCPYCYANSSKDENEIVEFIKTINSNLPIYTNDRDVLKGKEIDIYLPTLSLGIEYNGIYWHTEDKKGKYFHLNKTESCNKQGIKLIHIFEDEYLHHKDIVLHKIRHLINEDLKLPKIAGRKCTISQIDSNIANIFLNKYHIQGFAASTLYYGAFFNKELIAVMSFKKIGRGHENEWELTRFASNFNYCCQGVGGKLFKHFIKENNPILVKSFADRRWSNNENNLYMQLGFNFEGYLTPDYRYFTGNEVKREHKFNFRKQILLKKYPDILNNNMTEREMTEKLGYKRIYDCGLIKYIWKK